MATVLKAVVVTIASSIIHNTTSSTIYDYKSTLFFSNTINSTTSTRALEQYIAIVLYSALRTIVLQ